MWIELPEAVKIYARFCKARYGSGAGKAVREKANELKRRGDIHGHRIWTEVAEQIEHPTGTEGSFGQRQ
jgi:hypothetical protein